jgi:hypothetical protein
MAHAGARSAGEQLAPTGWIGILRTQHGANGASVVPRAEHAPALPSGPEVGLVRRRIREETGLMRGLFEHIARNRGLSVEEVVRAHVDSMPLKLGWIAETRELTRA